MKKRILSFLLALCLAPALLPATASAEAYPRSLSVIVDEPVEGQKPAATGTAAFAAGTQSTVTRVEWSGELDANGCFKANVAYTVTVTERLNADMAGSFRLQADDPRINYSEKATIVSVSADGMEATASYTFPPVQGNADKEAEKAAEEEWRQQAKAEREADAAKKREIAKTEFYTEAQANAAWWKLNQHELILDGSEGGNWVFPGLNGDDFSNITRMLLDYPNPDVDYLTAEWPDFYEGCFHNIQEVWLSPKVDCKKFFQDLDSSAASSSEGVYKVHSSGILNGMLTFYVPDTQMPNGLLDYASDAIEPEYSVKVYSGDVYEAYRQGDSAARDWCPGHDYTGKIQTASRMMQHMTCQQPEKWYYSCKWCGKCEYNPNHTFARDHHGNDTSNQVFPSHECYAYDLSDKNYLGVNERGEAVYLYSCIWCGVNQRELMVNYTYAQYLQELYAADTAENRANYQRVLDVYKKSWEVGGDSYAEAMKSSVDLYQGFGFAIPGGKNVNAKLSTWAQNEVKWAAQNDLIDAALLGGDYTGSVTRLQFCSVAVKMAEKMLGKAITPAPSGAFSDTDNEYVRKASAAGITTGVGDGKFDPNGTLTRQQMATFLYRALQYVKNNSDIRYTIYDSKLSSYADAGQLQSWATEPMAFMNALGLINGTSGTTLAPNDSCTIEQAVVVANRSLSANIIGWYQSLATGEKNVTGGGTNRNRDCFFGWIMAEIDDSGTLSQLRHRNSERFWVTGAAQRMDWVTRWDQAQGDFIRSLSIIDPYTGDTLYVLAGNFRPIKAD